MRGLSDPFLQSLTSGSLLFPLLNIVKLDDTLCLEIRDNTVNIYYRGGNLLQIEYKSNQFSAFFDRNYLDPAETFIPNLPEFLQSDEEVKLWLNTIPYLKHEMDL